jgi:hypothetical protein
LLTQVMADYRQQMWPLLGQTVLECRRIADWALNTFGTASLVAGGVSMGGDVALAFAGLDDRVSRVAGLLSTPDWTRPGMHGAETEGTLIDQGTADSYAQWFFTQLDPLTNINRFQRDILVQLQFARKDRHIPPSLAEPFASLVNSTGRSPSRGCEVVLRDRYDHLGGIHAEELYRSAATFLLE